MGSRLFDAVVVGGGHAGIEAARALVDKGLQVVLLTLDTQKIGAMSCNPAIGGVAKGHLVFEIDALGGWMGACADENSLQGRRLNQSKGPAVRSTRVQCDKDRYAETMVKWMGAHPNVTVLAGEAEKLLTEKTSAGEKVSGILTVKGETLTARAVVITSGTFMRGLMFCGFETQKGGRFGDSAAEKLTQSFLDLGHSVMRLKTGTPARLDARTINFALLEKQWGDSEVRKFSWKNSSLRLPQLSCYMTYTNERTHDVIRANFDKSPLFSGQIVGVGPRYCPSVEDKIKRFADRQRHHIFLEPEGLNTHSIYPNGLSTSLPANVQLEFLRTIEGLEKVELVRPGYAVEYDTLDPTQLSPGFMSKFCDGLFFAGQVNRTSGYEEAAAQGLWAGINASLYILESEMLQPDRSRSYIETLVDDLVRIGTEEPYRLFTSRSEFRLHLREDNAQERLFDLGCALGLLSEEQKRAHEKVLTNVNVLRETLLSQRKRLSVDRMMSYFDLLKRPEVTWESLTQEKEFAHSIPEEDAGILERAIEKIEVEAKYEGYLNRQESEIEELRKLQAMALDLTISVRSIPGLSNEVVEKVEKLQPQNVFELSRISGVTPAAVLKIARVMGRGPKGIVSRETSALG